MELVPIGGLCNRLRAIGSRLAAARKEGKTLTVWWVAARACLSRYSDLFCEPPPDLILHENKQWPAHAEVTCHVLPDSKVEDWVECAMATFKPLPAIQARIDAMLSRLGQDFSAVHIRRTDHNERYDEDIAYAEFAAAVPDQMCFAAADNPRSIVTLKRALGDRIVYAGAFRYTGNRMTQIADAVVDLWVASHAARFRGTYYSSFSDWIEMMRQVRGLPVGDLSKIERTQ